MVKNVLNSKFVTVPDDVQVTYKARKVVVKGPRGKLQREFKHLNLSMVRVAPNKIRIDAWFPAKKHSATVRTCASHIENMITGVRVGYQYHMRLVYAHFPISCNIEGGSKCEVRNYLGSKNTFKLPMEEGVEISNGALKGELILKGNDIEAVSKSAAAIQQSTKATGKDIRKFLDGIYVSEKRHVIEE